MEFDLIDNLKLREHLSFYGTPETEIQKAVYHYCFALLERNMLSQNGEGRDMLSVEICLELEGGGLYSSQKPQQLFWALNHLGESNAFSLWVSGKGAFGEFMVQRTVTEKGGLKSEMSLGREEHKWDGLGLGTLLETYAADCDYDYQFIANYLDSGEWRVQSVKEGCKIDPYAAMQWGMPEPTAGKWDSDSCFLKLTFDTVQHRDVLEKLRELVRVSIPDSEYQYWKSEWKEAPNVLLPGIQWYTTDMAVVQRFTGAANEILRQAGLEHQLEADGIWFDLEHFRIGSWGDTEDGLTLCYADL